MTISEGKVCTMRALVAWSESPRGQHKPQYFCISNFTVVKDTDMLMLHLGLIIKNLTNKSIITQIIMDILEAVVKNFNDETISMY